MPSVWKLPRCERHRNGRIRFKLSNAHRVEGLAALDPADHDIRTLHFPLACRDPEPDPSGRFGLHGELNRAVGRVDAPVEKHVCVLVQRGVVRVLGA